MEKPNANAIFSSVVLPKKQLPGGAFAAKSRVVRQALSKDVLTSSSVGKSNRCKKYNISDTALRLGRRSSNFSTLLLDCEIVRDVLVAEDPATLPDVSPVVLQPLITMPVAQKMNTAVIMYSATTACDRRWKRSRASTYLSFEGRTSLT